MAFNRSRLLSTGKCSTITQYSVLTKARCRFGPVCDQVGFLQNIFFWLFIGGFHESDDHTRKNHTTGAVSSDTSARWVFCPTRSITERFSLECCKTIKPQQYSKLIRTRSKHRTTDENCGKLVWISAESLQHEEKTGIKTTRNIHVC